MTCDDTPPEQLVWSRCGGECDDSTWDAVRSGVYRETNNALSRRVNVRVTGVTWSAVGQATERSLVWDY